MEKKLALGTVVSLGKPKLKNIAQRFAVYALLPEPPKGLRQRLQVQRLKLSRRVGIAHRVAAEASCCSFGALMATSASFSVQSSVLSPQSRTTQRLCRLPDKPSIVVLPFDNMSDDPQQDYFSNGITEVLTCDLSRISSLFVIARNTAFTYKGKATNVRTSGKNWACATCWKAACRRLAIRCGLSRS